MLPLMRRGLIPVLTFFVVASLGATSYAKPEAWSKAIAELTAADSANPPAPGGIVFVGSSSIVKWNSLSRDFSGENVIKRGFGGSELADSVYYADRLVMPYRPRSVVLYAGDNDLAAGKNAEQVFADFNRFVAKVHGALPRCLIVFIAIKPSPLRWHLREEYIRANKLIAAECALRPEHLRFVDVWQPMLGADGEPKPELFLSDHLHMNAAGYALWAPLVRAAIR